MWTNQLTVCPNKHNGPKQEMTHKSIYDGWSDQYDTTGVTKHNTITNHEKGRSTAQFVSKLNTKEENQKTLNSEFRHLV